MVRGHCAGSRSMSGRRESPRHEDVWCLPHFYVLDMCEYRRDADETLMMSLIPMMMMIAMKTTTTMLTTMMMIMMLMMVMMIPPPLPLLSRRVTPPADRR